MAFEIKNDLGDIIYKYNFDPQDFEIGDFKAETINMPLPFGTIKARQWHFDGIRMSYSEAEFTAPSVLDWKGDAEMVTMCFNLQGRLSILDDNMPNAFELGANQHNMFYGQHAAGKMQVDELIMKTFLIQLSKRSFLDIAKGGNDAIKSFAEAVDRGQPAAFSDMNLNIGFDLQNCINSILNCNYSNALKRMFFYSKTIEMMVLQAESYNKLMNNAPRYIKTDYDKERILFARDYLIRNMDAPPTLTELSRRAGINEFKLKRGFKEVFDKTVFEYLAEVRLETARIDLLEKQKSITEIAFELGYSSLQHFSAAFKKKFGIAPSKVV